MSGFYVEMGMPWSKGSYLVQAFGERDCEKEASNLHILSADEGKVSRVKVNLPYSAIKQLCERAQKTGEIIDLNKAVEHFKAKTGPFAPQP